MKKRTNKILWITLIVIALLVVVPFTVTFQVAAHRHPEMYQPASKVAANVLSQMDSIFGNQVVNVDEVVVMDGDDSLAVEVIEETVNE
ncbi:MAG: hypothetical protein IJU33_05260 [Bacteroidales bacterium]|nr:hypothetical protein [Bacteroidales bacterium]